MTHHDNVQRLLMAASSFDLPANFTVRNHYVPQWYQHRFLPAGQSKLWYLDLKPERILRDGKPVRRKNGAPVYRDALRQLGPINCFKQDHLYTLHFGPYSSDVIEKHFFGALDVQGEKAVAFFSDYGYRNGVHEAFRGMRNYLAAQLFRTPKGLDMLKELSGSTDHQQALITLQSSWQLFHTIWSEAVWEVVHCAASPTKFIMSDAPVAMYNRDVFPAAAEVLRFGGASIERVGTHTLLPLDMNRCLLITNLQHVRNPKGNASRRRENPRYFAPATFDLRRVQRGREVNEDTVIAINYVLKSQARRYVGAADKSWLYPEELLKTRQWSKLGGPLFLHPDPRKVRFTTGIVGGGYPDGSAWGYNEYGHSDLDDAKAEKLRAFEWKAFESAKTAWDEHDRRAGRAAPVDLKDYW